MIKRTLLALALAVGVLVGTGSLAAAQTCRWIDEGTALLCEEPGGEQTLSGWQGGGWVTVPAAVGATLPAAAGGLSAYGRSYPPSIVTPPTHYYSQSWTGNAVTQTVVVYGPGNTSRAITCVTQFWGNVAYRTCH